MNIAHKNLLLEYNEMTQLSDEHLKMLFDYCADQNDSDLQNVLISELMVRYADMSRQLEEKNAQLKVYNEHLEELVQEKVAEISASQMATIHALVKSTESRDDDTGAHIERTTGFCRALAEKLYEAGLYRDIVDKDYPENIAKASPLHDIGKVGIKDAILLKPGKLTDDEFAIMKTHVIIGYETLASIVKMYPENEFINTGIEITRYHHEKWDGSGYMKGLAGEEIPLSARIMALSDVYDALRSRRVYKEPFSHERTLEIITEERGKLFDPVLTDVFLEHNLLFKDIYDGLSV
jgi:putative two-component system response regulator